MLLGERLEPFHPIEQLSGRSEGPTLCPAQLEALSLSLRASGPGVAQETVKGE